MLHSVVSRLAFVVPAVLLAAGPAPAEFLFYPGCDAVVGGTLRAQASVGFSGGTRVDSDEFDYDQRIPIGGTSVGFSDTGSVGASVEASFLDGCLTTAGAKVGGETGYKLRGDDLVLQFALEGANDQADFIDRAPVGVSPGGAVAARTGYDIAGHNQYRLSVPFQVAGGDNGVLVVETFELKRTDSGPSTGWVTSSWEIYEDLNGDCELGPSEPLVASDSATIGTDDSHTGVPFRFRVPRGNYILGVSHHETSNLSADSADCTEEDRVESAIADSVAIAFRLITVP